jgi:hypothetical protein
MGITCSEVMSITAVFPSDATTLGVAQTLASPVFDMALNAEVKKLTTGNVVPRSLTAKPVPFSKLASPSVLPTSLSVNVDWLMISKVKPESVED